jgi:hypothetical protein
MRRQQEIPPSGAAGQPEPLIGACRASCGSRSFCLAAIAALALVAFAVRAASLDAQSLWRDEVDAMLFAAAPPDEVLSHFAQPRWNGPLYFLLLHGWIVLTGTSEYAMRFLSLFFGVLCVPLTYVLGRRLFNRQAGFVAALLVAVSPYLTWYSQEVKMYTLVPALTLLAIYALRHALSMPKGHALSMSKGRAVEGNGWRWWAVQMIATSLAFYMHILAALLIPVQVLLYFIWRPRARRRWIGVLVVLACLVLVYLPLAGWQVPLLIEPRETGFHRYGLLETAQILLNGWSLGYFGSFGWGYPWATLLMGGLATWGILSLVLSHRKRVAELGERLSLLCWLVFPVLAVWIVSHWQPLFTDRYFTWSAPAFYLLIGVGLAALWRSGSWSRWVTVVLVGLVLGFNVADQWQQATQQGKTNFRAAAAYVAANYATADAEKRVVQPPSSGVACEGCAFRAYVPVVLSRYHEYQGLVVFQIPHARYAFDYYFPYEGYPSADGLYTNHRYADGSYMMSEQEAAEAMEKMVGEYDVVWLVASESEMWDERGLVKGWLDANMRLTDKVEGEYLWVGVYRYER